MKRIFVFLFVCIALCGGAGAADSADRIAAVAVNEDIMVFFVPDDVSRRLSVRDRLIQSEDIADAAVIRDRLQSALSPEQYQSFIREYEQNQRAEAILYQTTLRSLKNTEIGLWLSERRIGSAWVSVYHNRTGRTDLWDEICVFERQYTRENGALNWKRYVSRTNPEEYIDDYALPNADIKYEVALDEEMDIAIYDLFGAHLAVIQSGKPEHIDYLETYYTLFSIADQPVDDIIGVKYDGCALYVCPLNDAETEAIRQGNPIQLEQREIAWGESMEVQTAF